MGTSFSISQQLLKQMLLYQYLTIFSFSLQKYPLEQLRPWPLSYRSNETCRPTLIDMETDAHKPIIEVAENSNPWNIFLEAVMPDSGLPVRTQAA